jgi:hypothetical protein
VHFYSSGAIEKDWKIKDLDENFMVAAFGSILGAVLRRPDDARFHNFPAAADFPQLLSAIMSGALPFAGKALMITLLGVGLRRRRGH